MNIADVTGEVVAGILIAFAVGATLSIRRIIHLLSILVDHVLPHFAPAVDEHGREVLGHTLPERVKKIEAELTFDHGTSVKDVVGQIARVNGIDTPSGPNDPTP